MTLSRELDERRPAATRVTADANAAASASPARYPIMSICRRTGCILRGTKHEIASWLWGAAPATGILL